MDSHKHVKISKSLSWLLRHGATKMALPIDKTGWVAVSDILMQPQFKKISASDIKCIVDACPKQRYALEERDNTLFIKANQGHSLQDVELELEEILSPEELPFIYHGTYYKWWPQIRAQGLSRKSRHHIHFIPDEPDSKAVISGIRQNVEILIKVNVQQTLAAGYKLYRSSNNVILCPGDKDGFLHPKCFSEITDRRTGKVIV